MINEITPMLITYNEIANISRVMDQIRWANEILVIDSGSTDGTIQVLAQIPEVRVIYRAFDSFAEQCNFGLQHVKTKWVLSLDADYVLSDELIVELTSLELNTGTNGYRTRFVYCVHGRPLRGSLYPPRTVMYRRDRAIYHNEGHGHRVAVEGEILSLRGTIYHDDRKPLQRWTSAQLRYAHQEATFLLSSDKNRLRKSDRLRLLAWPAPIVIFFYTLFAKRCILDGYRGWFYVAQRVLVEWLIAIEILEQRLEAQSRSRR